MHLVSPSEFCITIVSKFSRVLQSSQEKSKTLYSFKRIQKQISDPRFAGFRCRKEREIWNWICDVGNLSQTRAMCMTAWAFQEMTCFLLFDKLCDYTVQNFVVSSSNNDDGT